MSDKYAGHTLAGFKLKVLAQGRECTFHIDNPNGISWREARANIALWQDAPTILAERDRLKRDVETLRAALVSVAAQGGNLADDRLTDRTGPNDAAQRGIMYCNARNIAKVVLAQTEEKR